MRGNDVVDQAAAEELKLFVENDGDLHRQQGEPILKNLATKMAKGVYRHDLAVKLYGYLMENGAKKYAKEVGGAAWNVTFGPATRRAAAQEFALGFESEWAAGQYRNLLPKKYQAKAKPSPERRKLLAAAWKKTHRDYRSSTGGVKKVLHLGEAGTTLVPLDSLSDEQLRRTIGNPVTEEHGYPKQVEFAGTARSRLREGDFGD